MTGESIVARTTNVKLKLTKIYLNGESSNQLQLILL